MRFERERERVRGRASEDEPDSLFLICLVLGREDLLVLSSYLLIERKGFYFLAW
jgi:hypothetical protein